MILQDPQFVDEAGLNLHLGSTSPAIDAADGTLAPPLDSEGLARIDDPGQSNTGVGPPWADMGAFEYQP